MMKKSSISSLIRLFVERNADAAQQAVIVPMAVEMAMEVAMSHF